MTTPGFFSQAAAGQTFEKQVMEAIFQRQNVVCTFPQGYPVASLYTFPALSADGMAVIVCPDSYAIDRNLRTLRRVGAEFPEVGVLDGAQQPHEERELMTHINHHRVRLLYVTPEKFSSLNFLQIMAHQRISFLAVEEAQFLLEGFAGSYRYQSVWDGFRFLQKRPPVVLFTQPLAQSHLRELSNRLGLKNPAPFRRDPLMEGTQVRAKLLMTEHQKFRYLLDTLSGAPEKGQYGTILTPGTTIIQTANRKTCDRLAHNLMHHGFQSVYVYHSRLRHHERESIERAFVHQPNTIVVTSGYENRFLQCTGQSVVNILYWQIYTGMEELFGQVFRRLDPPDPAIQALILYTREDFEWAMSKLRLQQFGRGEELDKMRRHEIYALRRIRQWMLSDRCRVQSLAGAWNPDMALDLPPCGNCDTCTGQSFGGIFQRLLKPWLY